MTIRITLPVRSIYARLGFRKGVTELKPAEKEKVDKTIEEAKDIVHLKGAARIIGILQVDHVGIELEDGIILSSSSLARMLSGCTQVLLMGATAGQDIMDAIAQATSSDNLTRAVVLDAVASEMTDGALDWITDYVNQDLVRRVQHLTKKRFSAGYGDFHLENQKAMYDLLRMETIGVSITDRCILIPEKSVTAVAGVAALR
jgi:cobalamin-dependent methionine synthase I